MVRDGGGHDNVILVAGKNGNRPHRLAGRIRGTDGHRPLNGDIHVSLCVPLRIEQVERSIVSGRNQFVVAEHQPPRHGRRALFEGEEAVLVRLTDTFESVADKEEILHAAPITAHMPVVRAEGVITDHRTIGHIRPDDVDTGRPAFVTGSNRFNGVLLDAVPRTTAAIEIRCSFPPSTPDQKTLRTRFFRIAHRCAELVGEPAPRSWLDIAEKLLKRADDFSMTLTPWGGAGSTRATRP